MGPGPGQAAPAHTAFKGREAGKSRNQATPAATRNVEFNKAWNTFANSQLSWNIELKKRGTDSKHKKRATLRWPFLRLCLKPLDLGRAQNQKGKSTRV